MEDNINILPSIERDAELYIDPFNYYWQNRYYQELFHMNRNDNDLEKISNKIKKYKMENDSIEITWSFCKYFWESHIEFNMENLEEVCKIVNNVV